jgi:hypothetical protein
MADLGRNLFATLDSLEDLLEQTLAGPNRDTLQAQYDQLWDQAQGLVDANVRQATLEYNAAINILADANKKIQAAIDGLAKAIDVINEVAEVINIIATLLIKVGVI